MWKLGCLGFFTILIAIPVIASRILPWWGTLLVIFAEGAALIYVVPKIIGFAAKRFAMSLFDTKSKVLRGAMAHVHAVERVSVPPPNQLEDGSADANESQSRERQKHVRVDVTVTPRPTTGRMTHWEPSELMLVPFDTSISMKDDRESAGAAHVREVKLIDDSGQEVTDFDKINGKAKLRAVIECPETMTGRVKFRYYFEGFGDLMLP